MNKQELASKIWDTANELRGSMEASEYKDYILGFIFYKFLSEKEVHFLLEKSYEPEDIEELTEEDEKDVEWIQNNLGYFIASKNLFQTWIKLGSDFTVDNVRIALSAFHRNISPDDIKTFGGIFNTLEQGISKLGDTATSQTKAIRQLISLVNDVPTDNKEYDTLGYIYEYLIGQFAAGAGKKSGEFFTPHEVSILKSDIVANHLKDRKTMQIYDPTSGSGSLLLNIGQAVNNYIDDPNEIKYFAQEKIYNTYNLTRMNLVMHGILPDNMVVRNGDTLEHDFPFFEENDPEGKYEPVFVDAVVSNPPYSLRFDLTGKEHDPRFAEYGLAPKSKADYAFLLHCLYHIKQDGIVTIVLPHGVLFRGGEEGNIRKKLIEKYNIETIIGLPSNIFFGTGIPTIIMILKKKRKSSDILFVDASKGFEKQGNKNKLRSSDIKRIVDTVIHRKKVANYSHIAELDEIIKNKYNLNITRYVDSSEDTEQWDLYSEMFGGIPKIELTKYKDVWETMPNLYQDLYREKNKDYVELKSPNIRQLIEKNTGVAEFQRKYNELFEGYDDYISEILIDKVMSIQPIMMKEELTKDLFNRFEMIPLIDSYKVYQLFDDAWNIISTDIDVLHHDSFEAVRTVDPNMVMKTKAGKKVEVQEGWKGRILPFELVQVTLLNEYKEEIDTFEMRQVEIQEELIELIETLSEENGEYDVLNENNDKFSINETKAVLNELFEDVETPELNRLKEYADLLSAKGNKSVLLDFMNSHNEVDWGNMEKKKDGTISVKVIKEKIQKVQNNYTFQEGSYGAKLSKAIALLDEEKDLKKQIKEKKEVLHAITKETIENLSDDQAKELLQSKWFSHYVGSVQLLPTKLIGEIADKLLNIHKKYEKTFLEITNGIEHSSAELSASLELLTGDEFEMEAIREFKSLLQGDENEK